MTPNEPLPPPPASAEPMTVTRLAELFLKHTESQISKDHHYVRKSYLNKFVERYASWPLAAFKPFNISEWIVDHPTWRSKATKQCAILAVRLCFKWGVEQGLIPANPFAGVKATNTRITRRAMTDVEFGIQIG